MYRYIICFLFFLTDAATYVPSKQHEPMQLSKVTLVVKELLAELSLVFGVGLCIMGLYRYTLYRKNPLYHPFGSVLSIILLGLALIMLYYIPIAEI